MGLVDRRDRELEHVAKREAGRHATDELRDPVRGHARPGVTAGDGEAERHRRVEVRTRQRAEGRDRDGERDPVRERDVEEAATAAEGNRQDRAGADEDEPEGAAGFGDQLRQCLDKPRRIIQPGGHLEALDSQRMRLLSGLVIDFS